jgi:hypothetical protein
MSDLKEKLEQANKKAETQRKERRARVVKGSHLTEQLVTIGKDAGLTMRENTGFYVFSGKAGKNVRIAIAKRGGVVDFLSFSVESPAVRQVSKQEAQDKHLGRVEGRIAFDGTDEETIAAFKQAVTVLDTERPEPVATPKPPRTPRIPKAKPAEDVHSTNVAD